MRADRPLSWRLTSVCSGSGDSAPLLLLLLPVLVLLTATAAAVVLG
jgi:hypothetical protein